MGEREDLALPRGYQTQSVWVPPGPTTGEILAGTAAGVGAILARPLVRSLGVFGPYPPPDRKDPSAGVQAGGRPGTDGGTTDRGWFGPGSVSWRIHADTAMWVATVTAFALQALHPLALAGVAEHGSFVEDFFGRTQRTGEFVATVVYGTAAEAQAKVEQVYRVHEQVIGIAPDGRLYSANDPDLLAWVHVTEYLAVAATYRRFGLLPLKPGDLDRYIAESARVAEAMGIPDPPRSWAELDLAFQRFRPQLSVGEQTRAGMNLLRDPPGLQPRLRRAWSLLWAGGVACLPPTALELLGLERPRRSELVACRSLVRALATVLPTPPLLARHGLRFT